MQAGEIEAVEAYFDQMVAQQRKKVFELARRRVPRITEEDVLNPHDFPALLTDPHFNFEDGVLAGMIQSQIGLRANFLRGGAGSV